MECLEGMKQLDDNSVDLIVTDPPYNISGLSQGIDFGDWDYLFDPEEFIKEAKRVLKKNGQIYIFTSDRLMGKYIDLLIKYDYHYRNTLVWFKANLMPKIRHHTWRSGTEYILYAGQSKCDKCTDYTFNWLGQEEMKNLIVRNILGGGERELHPTQKPLDIIRKLIKVSSNEGDLILDCFLGSGTTCVACKQMNRRYIGFEINKEYFDIADKRLAQNTLHSFQNEGDVI
jgi:DNA modification methylase